MTTIESALRQQTGTVPRPRSAGDLVPGGPELRSSVRRPRAGAVVLTVRGDVDLLTAAEFAETVRGRLRDTDDVLVLDLSGVGFLGTAGLAVLAEVHDHAERRGHRLRVVAGGNRSVLRALTAGGLHRRLDLSPSVDLAVDTP
ncbi:STAS domain-containing protein [Qaidamihabitans albus]|uniref:STAS domain-containing protein n=1 Tax=Qaidamihabitans albus TaxID=2795733 RepID=UPI0018F148EE|nr:STAS domain-containing protein [Qaidamihabitans albus]